MNIVGQLNIPKLYQYNKICMLQIEHDGTEIRIVMKCDYRGKKYLLFSHALRIRSDHGSHLQKV